MISAEIYFLVSSYISCFHCCSPNGLCTSLLSCTPQC